MRVNTMLLLLISILTGYLSFISYFPILTPESLPSPALIFNLLPQWINNFVAQCFFSFILQSMLFFLGLFLVLVEDKMSPPFPHSRNLAASAMCIFSLLVWAPIIPSTADFIYFSGGLATYVHWFGRLTSAYVSLSL
jgi:uncharacterized sodium:solute symporter family permease YidK